jgi:AraC family transcriptional regulator
MDISSDHLNRINRAVNFINDDPSEELDLDRLAKIANYSPFHFQKLFRSIVGETPKQYILRIRLETAAHAVVMFHHRSITEIAMESGFSSPATFTRAFKRRFGISPHELRAIPHEERFRMLRNGEFGRHLLDTDIYFSVDEAEMGEPAAIYTGQVERIETIRGVFVGAPLADSDSISRAFRKVAQIAEVNELIAGDVKFVGALYPHRKLYEAIVAVSADTVIPRDIGKTEILGGKFAVITASGAMKRTFMALRSFERNWLPQSGYRIADIALFELFSAKPTETAYDDIERYIHVRVEPSI